MTTWYTSTSTRNREVKRLEPHFQTSATRSAPKEDTEGAVALEHSRECTKKLISALRPFFGSMGTFGATTYANGNSGVQKFFFKHIAFKEQPKIPRTAAVGKKEKKCCCCCWWWFFFPPLAVGGAICFFWLQVVNTLIETSSCDD